MSGCLIPASYSVWIFCHLHKKSSHEKLGLCCYDRNLLLLCVLLWKGCSFPLWYQQGEGDQTQKHLVCFESDFFFPEVFLIQLLCNEQKYLVKKRHVPPLLSTSPIPNPTLPPPQKKRKTPLIQQNSILAENSNRLLIYLAIANADSFGKTILRL